MSGLANLFNVPRTEDERAAWSFSHMAHHRDINAAIYRLLAVALPEYILDPIDPNDSGQWEYQHQLMHDNENAILGIQGQDLTGIDWKNPQILEAWVFLNANEHYQAAEILLIG